LFFSVWSFPSLLVSLLSFADKTEQFF
jgi:hypothetical protein